jgi:hypothetical protein
MSATRLELQSSKALRRFALLSSYGSDLTVALYANADAPLQMLAYANAQLPRCQLHVDPRAPCLWIDNAAFDVTVSEAARIRASFEPLGLRIEKAAAQARA